MTPETSTPSAAPAPDAVDKADTTKVATPISIWTSPDLRQAIDRLSKDHARQRAALDLRLDPYGLD